MKKIYNITTLIDWYNEGSYYLVEVIKSMREEVQNNNIIVIEQEYINAPAVELFRFDTLKALNDWIKKQFPDLEQE
jgi:hypothetical protein